MLLGRSWTCGLNMASRATLGSDTSAGVCGGGDSVVRCDDHECDLESSGVGGILKSRSAMRPSSTMTTRPSSLSKETARPHASRPFIMIFDDEDEEQEKNERRRRQSQSLIMEEVKR